MDFLTDESLISQVQNGKVDACGLLYKRYKKDLFSYFHNNIRDREKSEDLVHVTFEKIIKYNKNFRAKSTFKQWLFSIAKNALIDEYHKKKKHQTADLSHHQKDYSHSDHREKTMIKDEKTELLYKAISLLSPEKRALISMVKLNEMKYKEVAKMYDLTEANVKVKVFRIMQELKSYTIKVKKEYK